MVGDMGSVIDHFYFRKLSKENYYYEVNKMKLSETYKYFNILVTESSKILNIHDSLMLRNKMKLLLTALDLLCVNSNFIYTQLKQKNMLHLGALSDKLEIAEKLLLDNQNNLESASAYVLNYENKILKKLIIREAAEYQKGLASGNIKLEKYLFCSEFEDIDNKLKLPVVKRWYENYDQITFIRNQKLENQISWDQMKSRINKILRLK